MNHDPSKVTGHHKEPVDTPIKHLNRLANAFVYSLKGFEAAYREEAAIRLEAWGLLVFIPLALYLPHELWAKALLCSSALLVPIVELLNSALEAVVDRIGYEHHELSGRAKDIGSAAVFLAVAQAVLVWAICLWPMASKALSG